MRKTKASAYILAATIVTVATLFLLPYTPKTAVPMAVVTRGDLALVTRMEGAVCYQNEQPCLALQAGRVSAVYARKGAGVKRGELLFALDSGREEQAIAALSQLVYEQEAALAAFDYGDALAAACAQSLIDARVQLEELRLASELKRVRALDDGVVGGVYVREGDYVAEGAALGLVYGEGAQIMATCRAADAAEAAPGAPAYVYDASGKRLGLASLSLTGMPALNGATAQLMQTLRFTPEDDGVLADADIGDTVVVELLNAALENKALTPIASVGEGDMLWLVTDGRAVPVRIDAGKRNESYVCVPEQYLGCTVILTPDSFDLYPGCPVKEMKRK